MIFVIHGNFNNLQASQQLDVIRPNQHYFHVSDIQKRYDLEIKNGTYKLNSGGVDQSQMDKALEESMKAFQNMNNKKDEKKEPEFFQGQGVSLQNTNDQTKSGMFMEIDDPEELHVIKLSLQDVMVFIMVNLSEF
jgi:hypothetical protein